MGYGIVLHLDDSAARSLVASEGTLALGESLLGALGSDSYPSPAAPPVASGPWTSLGAFHSSARSGFRVTGSGSSALPLSALEGDGDAWAWDASWTPGRAAAAARSVLARPHEYALAAASGDLASAVFGPDRVSGRSLASLWWFYADALSLGVSAAGLGAGAARLLETSREASCDSGSHASALNKAGALLFPGTVHLAWSMNRVCLVSDLTGPERLRGVS